MPAEEGSGGEGSWQEAFSPLCGESEPEDLVRCRNAGVSTFWSTSIFCKSYRVLNSSTLCLTLWWQEWYSQARWNELATLFTETHHQLYSLPSRPLLLIALSAGLSALKTPSCHSAHASSTANASSTTTSVCPICSTELNEVSRKLPYAHHTKSHVENDPIVLPNGRVYGRNRLTEYCKKIGLDESEIRDPPTSETFA